MKAFKAEKEVRRFNLRFNASAEVIFPLLCPEREKEWIPGWEYEMIYSKSGLIEEGCVFKTYEYEVETIWLVAKHDQNKKEILFIQFAKDLIIAEFSVVLSENEAETTDAAVQYIYTPLNKEGKEYIDRELSQEILDEEMGKMEMVMNYYLQNS
ncbi:hypothetical protein SAMN05660297_01117 [Natronincola peptidivorans]|uniref:Activator of Hsp90 ATPase homolog 1-like protein n=1 Tax=Natronincola peptidivorans TaxID=426128 RepID=A0A1I0AZN5_9FIRM|nr:hypothetical protein [Natronincola peptidivorans]SES99111.1 hypothetical protein SAMN05660297_01117 [Natronincola peptidivorans]